MRTEHDLSRILASIDRRGYPAYKQLAGTYSFGGGHLCIDHVQGDPFASPSELSVCLPLAQGGWPRALLNEPHRRVALEDFLLRRFARELARYSFRATGSGKSGLLATSRLGQEVLSRSACEISEDIITVRLAAGFPAHGRSTDARALEAMLIDYIPACVDNALVATPAALAQAKAAIELADDQHAIRRQLRELGLVAFVADGSFLPRQSGVSALPLRSAKPFRAPESLSVELSVPYRGRVRGLGIRRGVTLIVGGGYHGKSTLLSALQEGVYNHVAGDGRELVICEDSAAKLRAEDGRAVTGVDISAFIGTLPNGATTTHFSTPDASGSTSQAASTVEAIAQGATTLLIDEDTSATNFMVRDQLMEAVVSREHEPITPFVERVRSLWERQGISSVIVAGSSGSFFSVADTVIQMESYEARDITERAQSVCAKLGAPATPSAPGFAPISDGATCPVRIAGEARRTRGGRGKAPAQEREDGRGERIRARASRDSLQVGNGSADLRLVEQLVSEEQTCAIAQMLRWAAASSLLDGTHTVREVVDATFAALERKGWSMLGEHETPSCALALPRRHELACALRRWRRA